MSVNILSSINQKFVQDFTKNNEVLTENTPVPVKTIDKKKLAVGIAAGIGITALVVGGILYNKKINSNTVKQLAEHIDFSEAQTLEDAIKFGSENLGIKKYKGFSKTDLDVINWINEGLVNINNKTKGKAPMPKKIVYKSLGLKNDLVVGGAMTEDGVLTISKKQIADVKKGVIHYIKKVNKSSVKAQEFSDELDKKNNFKFWQNSAIKLFGNKISKQCNTSTFSTINHEIGHLQHAISANASFDALDSKYADLFKQSKNIAEKVSKYAASSPTEFVAECYSKLVDGIKLDDDVIDLYQKLGGVLI